jgi:hypothetical protein
MLADCDFRLMLQSADVPVVVINDAFLMLFSDVPVVLPPALIISVLQYA